LFEVGLQLKQFLELAGRHIHVLVGIHIPSSLDQSLNNEEALFLIGCSNELPDELLLASRYSHEGRGVDAVDTLLYDEDSPPSLDLLNAETVLQV
jgi:hypothetical protein